MSQYRKLLLLAGLLLPLSGFAQDTVLNIGSGYFGPVDSQSNDGIPAANTIAQNVASSGDTSLNSLAIAEGKTYTVNAGSLTVLGEILLHPNTTLIVQGNISAQNIVVENGATIKVDNSNSGNGNTAKIQAKLITLEWVNNTMQEDKKTTGKLKTIANAGTPQLYLVASQVNVNSIQGIGAINSQNSLVNMCFEQKASGIQLQGEIRTQC
ncbi:MAG: hypothetical protein K0S08_1459 [Gammaproteobacteria bacterium]|jgi:hypothetical protein|nr:hypothetical protein [Gammaproteobacteria bacterium]